MARKPRIHIPGALFHVILRGNARQDIFYEQTDRCRFYLLLQEGLERFGHRIHAFCLMSNHVHLALQSGEVPLSRLVQNLCFRYTRWINRRLDRSGHLFQGRFKAVLIDADTYLLQLVRYIHLNPVRAGITDKPGDYPWSSHNAYCGQENIPWLTHEWVLSRFSAKQGSAVKAYTKFVMSGMREEHREEFYGRAGEDGRVLGSDGFIGKILEQTGGKPARSLTVESVIELVCARYGIVKDALWAPGKDRLASEARAMASWLLMETRCGTLAELCRHVNRDISTLSSAVRRLQLRAKSDETLASTMKDLLGSVD